MLQTVEKGYECVSGGISDCHGAGADEMGLGVESPYSFKEFILCIHM